MEKLLKQQRIRSLSKNNSQQKIISSQNFNQDSFAIPQSDSKNQSIHLSRINGDLNQILDIQNESQQTIQGFKNHIYSQQRVIQNLQKQIEQINFQLQYKEIALQKREQFLQDYAKENNKLKEQIFILEQKLKNKDQKDPKNIVVLSEPEKTQTFTSYKIRLSTGLSQKKQKFPLVTSEEQQPRLQHKLKLNPFSLHQGQSEQKEQELKQSQSTNQITLFKQTRFQDEDDKNKRNNNFLLKNPSPNLNRNMSSSSPTPLKRQNSSSQSPSKKKIKKVEMRDLPDKRNHSIIPEISELKKLKQDNRIQWIQDFVSHSDEFFDKISLETSFGKINLSNQIKYLLEEYQRNIDIIIVMKKSHQIISLLASSLSTEETISNILYHLKNTIEAEQVNLFLYDDSLNQMWKPNDPGHKISPIHGVLKYCINSNELIKVEDIVYDTRYDPKIDSQGYENVKSLIWAPINNKQGEIKALIQVINYQVHDRVMQLEDEEIISLISVPLGNALQSTFQYEQAILNQYRFMTLLKISSKIQRANKVQDLLIEAKDCLQDLLKTEKCVIYQISSDQKFLIKYDRNKEARKFDIKTGICGQVALTGISIDCAHHQAHPEVNLLVDIDTQMPSFTNLIKSDGKNVAIVQVASLQPHIGGQNSRYVMLYKQVIDFFCDLVGSSISRIDSLSEMVSESFTKVLNSHGKVNQIKNTNN